MTRFYHDSRDITCREPFGAVPEGTQITLRAYTRETCSVTLRLWTRDAKEMLLAMTRLPDGEGYRHEAKIAAGAPGLLWYYFIADGHVFCAPPDGLGGQSESSADGQIHSHQITVYKAGFQTPEWMRDAAVYQIFPDRFFDGENGRLLARRSDITVHTDKTEPPYQIPGERSGELRADDFYGGNLSGVLQKLPYLSGLGITALYLNPIFKAFSNHKYDVGDYHTVDPTFGDNDTFTRLCAEAKKLGIRVLLDGVFSHVGEDSRYFNRYGGYAGEGAYQSPQSPYYPWFTFYEFPDKYRCWWDIETLPQLNHENPGLRRFLTEGEACVPVFWQRLGASGWRLDVADELPDELIRDLRRCIKTADPQAAIIGEVWEDATNKISYGHLRSYALGDGLDSLMNYPLREALIRFLLFQEGSDLLKRRIDALHENYPLPMFYALMNVIGTHDRSRILNILGECDDQTLDRYERGKIKMTPEQRALGLKRLRQMIRAVCVLPGMPAIYYGDEAGMEGMNDPLCRGYFPWGQEDTALTGFVREQLALRKASPVLRTGCLRLYAPHPDVLVIERRFDGRDAFGDPQDPDCQFTVINRAEQRTITIALPSGETVKLDG